MSGLTARETAQFRDQGFLVVKGLFEPEADLDPIIEEYEGVLDRLAHRLAESGRISSPYDELSFSKRLIKIQQELGQPLVQHFDFSLPQKGIEPDTPIWLGKAVFNILRNPRLLDAVESIIGPEIYSNPVQHVRLKMPDGDIPEHLKNNVKVGVTPWHQDNGVLMPEADATEMITVWFPLWDAPISAGPLKIVPLSHLGGLITHCPTANGANIPDRMLEERQMLAVPMKRGDAFIMHRLTCHGSLPNLSENIRCSFDLRYHPTGQATGRDLFPGFVARSRAAPETELHDADLWARKWLDARAQLSAVREDKTFNRWDGSAPVCA